MNKYMRNIALVAIILTFSTMQLYQDKVYGEESDDTKTYIVYDCITGEESEIVVDSDEENEGAESLIDDSYEGTQGKDSRIIIPGRELEKVNVKESPYSKILCLKMGVDCDGDGDADRWIYGTGFMVYLDIMLTSGHNIYTADYGRIVDMKIYVYQQNGELNDAYVTPAKYSVSPELVKGNYTQYDWGIVILQHELGRSTGWFEYDTATIGMQTYVTVSGYPYEEGYTHYQYESMGLFQRYNSYYFRHKCSTLDGMSGAPLFDDNGVVWGIHTRYDKDDKSYNGGMLIDSDLRDWIDSWK